MKKHANPVIRTLKDTRGLPVGLDPRYFYEYASSRRRQLATGLEGLLYKIMPYNLISSLAFAIDPFRQFKTSVGRVSPAVRTRTRTTMSALQTRFVGGHREYDQDGYIYDPPNGYSQPVHFVDHWGYYINPQEPLEQRTEDSTRRLRVEGSDIGEFRKWKCSIDSSSRNIRHEERQDVFWPYGNGGGYYFRKRDSREGFIQGPAATISAWDSNAYRNSQWAFSEQLLQKNALSMYRGLTPSGRTYTLARNVVELRDLPRGILQLQKSLIHLKQLSVSLKIPNSVLARIHAFKTIGKDIPKEWLSYSFGWRQTYSDIRGLLSTPTRIGKRINFLISRNGQATTYRKTRSLEFLETPSSGLQYAGIPEDSLFDLKHTLLRKAELKMVVNSTFEFPPVDLPTLRHREWVRQLGLIPTPTDLYNLVPWTWLVDWFTGLGNYVEVIDTINTDQELINWGLFTCLLTGELQTQCTVKTTSTFITGYGPNNGATASNRILTFPHSSTYSFQSQVRKDISSVLNVKTTADPSSLSTFQLSILGSLLAGRLHFR